MSGASRGSSARRCGRFGDPDEVAAVVSFLASDDAAIVSGEVLNVSGGWFRRP